MVRVRFAPSPTGYLHVGGARTALFNWLFARQHGGIFILRIEDTDTERSSAEMVTGILDGLRWLGLDWDEGPGIGGPHGPYLPVAALRQAPGCGRVVGGRGTRVLLLLLRRSAARGTGARRGTRRSLAVRPRLPEPVLREKGGARGFAHAARSSLQGAGGYYRIRRCGAWANRVRRREHRRLRDPTVRRTSGLPPVGRRGRHRHGDHARDSRRRSHLEYPEARAALPGAGRGSTAVRACALDPRRRQEAIEQAPRGDVRHGVQEGAGYLPEALVNFLALLGWSPGDDRELMSRQELIQSFTLEGISGGNAVFDTAKLDWMNGQYIARMPLDQLGAVVVTLLAREGLWPNDKPPDDRLFRLLELLRPRAKRLTDFVEQARPFLVDTVEYEEEAINKHLNSPRLADHVAALVGALRDVSPFDESHVEAAVRRTAEAQDIKAGPLIHAARVAATGRTTSPGIFEVLALLGPDRTIARLEQLIRFLGAKTA